MEIRLDDYCNHWIEWVRCPFAIWYGYISSSNMICKYTQHHTYKARCLPQEIDISEVLRLPQKMTVILRKSFKYFAGHTKGFSTHVINTWECCQVPHPPHKKTHQCHWTVILRKSFKSIAPVTQSDFRHAISHVGMSPSATPATKLHVTSCKTFKNHNFRRFATGTTISSPLRTVADGYQRQATSSEHTSTPSPPKINENPSLCIRELYIYTHINLDHPH